MSDPLEIFKQSVLEYSDISKQLTKAAKELSLFRKKRDELGDLILEFMQQNQYDAVTSGDTVILKKTITRKTGLKEDMILQTVKQFLGDSEAAKFIEKLNESRETITKEKINVKMNKK